MKYITNRSDVKVCLECLKLFVKKEDYCCCPGCNGHIGMEFHKFAAHDQEYILENQ